MSGNVLQRAPQAAADWPGTRQPAEAGRRPWGGGARQPCPCPIPSLDPPPICAPSPISAPRSTPLTSPRCPPVPMYLSPPRGPAPRPQACVTALRPSGPFHPHPAPVSHSCPRPPPRRRPPSRSAPTRSLLQSPLPAPSPASAPPARPLLGPEARAAPAPAWTWPGRPWGPFCAAPSPCPSHSQPWRGRRRWGSVRRLRGSCSKPGDATTPSRSGASGARLGPAPSSHWPAALGAGTSRGSGPIRARLICGNAGGA